MVPGMEVVAMVPGMEVVVLVPGMEVVVLVSGMEVAAEPEVVAEQVEAAAAMEFPPRSTVA